MDRITAEAMVGDVVSAHPGLASVFEEAGLDYCCGGRRSLATACAGRDIELTAFISRLEDAIESREKGAEDLDPAALSLTALADHIEQTHHVFLRTELPRLDQLTARVAERHGPQDPRLVDLRRTFLGMAEELQFHMLKEEQILFPAIRTIETADPGHGLCGSISAPIEMMESEHAAVGGALEKMRDLTAGYTPPEWACNSYRALLDGLDMLERDLHLHIHKENNVLFPRALDAERKA